MATTVELDVTKCHSCALPRTVTCVVINDGQVSLCPEHWTLVYVTRRGAARLMATDLLTAAEVRGGDDGGG